MADTTGKDQLFGETLPGTGGDFIDTTDVEGHMSDQDKIDQGGPEGVAGGIRVRTPNVTGEDVEGHRNPLHREAIPTEGGPEGSRNPTKMNLTGSDEDDVEGHIYTGGPSTQGEFAKRGPGENPHGDRVR